MIQSSNIVTSRYQQNLKGTLKESLCTETLLLDRSPQEIFCILCITGHDCHKFFYTDCIMDGKCVTYRHKNSNSAVPLHTVYVY